MSAHASLDPELYGLHKGAERTFRAFLRRQMSDPDAILLLAEAQSDRSNLGYTLARIGMRAPVYRVQEIGIVLELVVAPKSRRQGVGRALIEAVEARFRRRGITYVQANYSPMNPTSSTFWPAAGYSAFLTEAYRRL